MKLHELLCLRRSDEIYSKYNELYNIDVAYGTVKSVKVIMDYLRSLSPIESNECISIEEFENKTCVSVLDKNERFNLVFLDWGLLIGMDIESNTLNKYSPETIIAHILWAITFFGWSEEEMIQERCKLLELLKDAESGVSSFYTLDEVMERLKEHELELAKQKKEI